MSSVADRSLRSKTGSLADVLFERHRRDVCVRADRLFVLVMAVQWMFGIVLAITVSPRTWAGSISAPHVHVYAAVLLGALLSSLPIYLALRRPGEALTRHVIAAAQMLWSALLIHLTGGRIETHFHVFGSLAFLAFYRDWRLLITPTIVVVVDHFLRGVYWPESVFGVLTASPWRPLEHAGWVLFEDVFLIYSIRQSVREMRDMAHQRAELAATNEVIEREVVRRTGELARRTGELELTAAQLAESEARHRGVLVTSIYPVVLIDVRGVIQSASDSVADVFGWTPEELIGRNVSVLMPEPYCSRHDGYLAEYHRTGRTNILGHTRELVAQRRDGSTFPCDVTVARVDVPGKREPLFSGTIRDTTERKVAQETLRTTNEELARKNQELEQFVYTVSHDLKSPLVNIHGFSSHIQKDAAEGRFDRLPAFAGRIEDGVLRMRSIIDDLLAIGRVGRIVHDPEPVDVAALIDAWRTDNAERLSAAGAAIKVQPDMPIVLFDRLRMEEVFDNLLTNARKYGGSEGGSVIRVGAERQSGEVRFCVADDGPGIAAEYHEKIFGLFQRLHRDADGSGVGLALVKHSVEFQHGRVWVESTPGEGATFWVAFPDAIVMAKDRTAARSLERVTT